MITKIMTGHEAILCGAELIRQGQVVAFPTETVYGLAGNALDRQCVAKIYEAKGRPADNPLIVHVEKIEDIVPLVRDISPSNMKVIKAFMPGAITLLFPKSELIPFAVTAGLNTVAIRMPKHKIAREFIRACGVPLAAPSANRSTRISPTTAGHVYEDMQGRIPLIIDGGSSDIGIESTVLDLTGNIPTILRLGAITADMLLEVIGAVSTYSGEIKIAKAPGMKYKHYAPLVDLILARNIERLISEYDNITKSGSSPLLLIPDKYVTVAKGRKHINLGESDDDICKNIYNAMREGEKISDTLLCIDLSGSQLGDAVMNRVSKASTRRLDY